MVGQVDRVADAAQGTPADQLADWIEAMFELSDRSPPGFCELMYSDAPQNVRLLIIAVLPADQVHIADRVILAGARAILLSPFTHATLISTIGRINELIQRGKTKPHETISKRELKNNCVVVYSPKGGVGCSTIAVNLAIDLHRQTKEKVLLVDGKSALGHIALMLNIRTANTIADLIHMAGKLDPELIRQVDPAMPGWISISPVRPAPPSAVWGRPCSSSFVCRMRPITASPPFCTLCGSCWFQARGFSNGTRRGKSIGRGGRT